jgi:hypothetical protein
MCVYEAVRVNTYPSDTHTSSPSFLLHEQGVLKLRWCVYGTLSQHYSSERNPFSLAVVSRPWFAPRGELVESGEHAVCDLIGSRRHLRVQWRAGACWGMEGSLLGHGARAGLVGWWASGLVLGVLSLRFGRRGSAGGPKQPSPTATHPYIAPSHVTFSAL